MYIAAAKNLQPQCGRECGFAGEEKEHATILSILNKSDLDGLPTNNLIAERDLSRFKAKNIQNNLMLNKNKKAVKIDKVSKKIAAILSERGTQWNEAQNEKLKEKFEKLES